MDGQRRLVANRRCVRELIPSGPYATKRAEASRRENGRRNLEIEIQAQALLDGWDGCHREGILKMLEQLRSDLKRIDDVILAVERIARHA
jgi:hypothetical protein